MRIQPQGPSVRHAPPPPRPAVLTLARELAFSAACIFLPLVIATLPGLRTDPWDRIDAATSEDDSGVGDVALYTFGCEAQVAAGLALPDFPCGGTHAQQLQHILAAPHFYWLVRPARLCDLAMLLWVGGHLMVIAVTAAALAAVAVELLRARRHSDADGRRQPFTATAAAAVAKAPLCVYHAAREPLLLAAAPYKCGLVQLAAAVVWRARRGAGCIAAAAAKAPASPESVWGLGWWRLTGTARLVAFTRSYPLAAAAIGVMATACHQVRPRLTTSLAVTAAASCLILTLAVPRLVGLAAAEGALPPAATGSSAFAAAVAKSRWAALRSMLLPTLVAYGAPVLYVNWPCAAAAAVAGGVGYVSKWPGWGLLFAGAVHALRRRSAVLIAAAAAASAAAAATATSSRYRLRQAGREERSGGEESEDHEREGAPPEGSGAAGPSPHGDRGREPPSGSLRLVMQLRQGLLTRPPSEPRPGEVERERPQREGASGRPVTPSSPATPGEPDEPAGRPSEPGTGLPPAGPLAAPAGLQAAPGGQITAPLTPRARRGDPGGAAAGAGAGGRPSALYKSPLRMRTVVVHAKYHTPQHMPYEEAATALRAAAAASARDVVEAAAALAAADAARPAAAVVAAADAARPHPGAAVQQPVEQAHGQPPEARLVGAQEAAGTAAPQRPAGLLHPRGMHVDCLTLPGCVQLTVVARLRGGGGGGEGEGSDDEQPGSERGESGDGGAAGGDVGESAEAAEAAEGLRRSMHAAVTAAAERLGMRELPLRSDETAAAEAVAAVGADDEEAAAAAVTPVAPPLLYLVPAVLPHSAFAENAAPQKRTVRLYMPPDLMEEWGGPQPVPMYLPEWEARWLQGDPEGHPGRRLMVMATTHGSVAAAAAPPPVAVYPRSPGFTPPPSLASRSTYRDSSNDGSTTGVRTGTPGPDEPAGGCLTLQLPADLLQALGAPVGLDSGFSRTSGDGQERGMPAAAARMYPLVVLHLLGMTPPQERDNEVAGAGAAGGAGAGAGAGAAAQPVATWLGCAPLLLAPPGPASELHVLWDRMVGEKEEALGWPEGEAPPGYSLAAAAAFREHLEPLLEDMAVLAAAAAAVLPAPAAASAVAAAAGGAHPAWSRAQSDLELPRDVPLGLSPATPQQYRARSPTASFSDGSSDGGPPRGNPAALTAGSAAAVPASVDPALVQLLRPVLLGFLEGQDMWQTREWLAGEGGGSGGGSSGSGSGGGSGSGAGGGGTARGSEGSDTMDPGAEEDGAGRGAAGGRTYSQQAPPPSTLPDGGAAVRRVSDPGAAVEASGAATGGPKAATDTARPGTTAAQSPPPPVIAAPICATRPTTHTALAPRAAPKPTFKAWPQGLVRPWVGFPDPDLEAAYGAWKADRAAKSSGVVATFSGLGLVAALVTKLRLEWSGIEQPLAKALAGMLWLTSPLAGQALRGAVLRLLLQQAARTGKDRPVGQFDEPEQPGGSGSTVMTDASPLTRPVPDVLLSWYDTLAAASTGLIASVLGLLTYTCSRPALDVRQDEAGFVFGILMGRAVLPTMLTQLRLPAQLLVSFGMAAVDVVHAHVLWGRGGGGGVGGVASGIASALLAAAAAAVAASNMAISAVLDARQRRAFLVAVPAAARLRKGGPQPTEKDGAEADGDG